MKYLKFSLLIVFAISTIAVNAQSSTLNRQLQAVWDKYLSSYDLSSDHDLTYGSLDDNDYTYYRITMKKYWTYRITAVCDGDCGDIDLYLYDEYGNLVSSDEKVDDYPIVGTAPSYTATYKLKVKMVECNIEPCRFGIAVFRK